ncbi:Mitochondrial acidic protein mam33 [Geranomyces variabilis]|nr:Mitochondrial acidic protein mam33 [Geranomyces variabilis]
MFRLAPRILAPIARLAVSRAAAPAPARVATAAMRAFSASSNARMSAGTTDDELHSTLLREINHEKEQNADGAAPEFLTEFQSSNKQWAIRDEPRNKEVALVREFENEKITVLFNTDALDEADQLEQEELEGAEEDQDAERPLSVPVSIIIEKPAAPTAGALEISATVQDGGFFIESADFTPSPTLAHDATAEGDWTRRSKYSGPFFGNLDEGLQEQFHEFLAERGLGDELADFIPLYVEYKEQKEYQTWLENVAEFVKI